MRLMRLVAVCDFRLEWLASTMQAPGDWISSAAWRRKSHLTIMPEFPPLFVFAVILVGFVLTNLALTHLIGPRKRTPVKDMTYESGMDPIGDARQPFNVRFCLVAIRKAAMLPVDKWLTCADVNTAA